MLTYVRAAIDMCAQMSGQVWSCSDMALAQKSHSMSKFQDRLRQVRGKLTQEEISNQLDIHSITYGRYERGERSPGVEFVEKVCRAFNISPTWLILGEGPMRLDEAAVPAPAPAAPLNQELLRQVLAGVKKGLALKRLVLSPDKEAELVALLYDHYAKTGESPAEQTVERYLRLVA